MTELAFPPIEAAPAQLPAVKTPKLTDVAVAALRTMEPDLQTLAERHRDVALDLSTPKGLIAAKAVRHELRESGRFAVQRARDATKGLINEAKKLIETEAERLIAIVQPVEDSYHAQIEAREKQLEQERAERDRIERERKAKHEQAIATIRAYVDLAKGQPIEKLAAGIVHVNQMLLSFDPIPWEEYADAAVLAIGQTLDTLEEMQAKAIAEEAAAAERARERADAERLRRENEALQAQVAAANAAAAAAQAAQAATAPPPPVTMADQIRSIEPISTVTAEQQAVMDDANRQMQAITRILTVPMGRPLLAPAEQQTDDTLPITTGTLCDRLGFTVTVQFMKHLGFEPVPMQKAGHYWAAGDWPAIKAALVKHITELP